MPLCTWLVKNLDSFIPCNLVLSFGSTLDIHSVGSRSDAQSLMRRLETSLKTEKVICLRSKYIIIQ